MLEHLGDHDGFMRQDSPREPRPRSDSVFRQPQAVLVGPGFALKLLEESLIVPDLQILDAAEHSNVAYDRRALTKMRRNDDAPLTIELTRLTVVVHTVEELETRRMVSGHFHQLPLDFEPRCHRVDADVLTGQA